MNIVIIGASGGIGSALTALFAGDVSNRVFALVRRQPDAPRDEVHYVTVDFQDESSLSIASQACAADGDTDIVVNTVGTLHGDGVHPEKSIRDISRHAFEACFFANCTCAALALKYFAPTLARQRPAVFASLSARVGSITDNRLGGWYSYRASKAAHNMIIKSAGIELARTHKLAAVIGIHPGTVDTKLSKPFTKHLDRSLVFTPDYAAMRIREVIRRIDAEDSGKVFAHDGSEVPA